MGEPDETGIIPTAGISVDGQAVPQLHVDQGGSWDANGAWTTNYSAIGGKSPDNGDRWGDPLPRLASAPREG